MQFGYKVLFKYICLIIGLIFFSFGPLYSICTPPPPNFSQQQIIDLKNVQGNQSTLHFYILDAEYLLVGFSSASCSHCAEKANWMNTNNEFQNKVSGDGSCEFITLVHDEPDPSKAITKRLNNPLVGGNTSFVGSRSRVVVDAENTWYTTPTVYGGPAISGTPTFMIIDRQGKMIAMKQGELPSLFNTLCVPNSCNGQGNSPTTGKVEQPGGGSCSGGGGGTTPGGTTPGGTTPGGTTPGGTTPGGTTPGGTTPGGTTPGGTTPGGTTPGGTTPGGTTPGGTTPGGTTPGGTTPGGTTPGGTTPGGTTPGGTTPGGTTPGGTTPGGTTPGGTTPGGTTPGGTTPGGTTPGGTTPGGTTPGGTTPGGTTPGGTTPGGTTPGGTTPGGTSAGGTSAGGVIGDMRPGRLQLEIPVTNGLQTDIVALQKELNSQNSKESLKGFFRILNEWMWMLLMLVLFIGVIYAGYTLITSLGDSDKMKTGMRMLLYVVFGLVIAILSWAVISLVAGMFA